MKRRTFIKSGSMATAGFIGSARAFGMDNPITDLEKDQAKVNFIRDGLNLTIPESIHVLEEMYNSVPFDGDIYSRGGVVEELEKKMAALLGKESAVFMPTGTLANHIAIRKLAGDRRRVIVQANSHIYRDSGDCATTLSNLNLIPLNPLVPTFSVEDVERVLLNTREGRTKTDVGVISIESPFRRSNNQMFEFEMMKDVTGFARDNDIGLHLDGARLFNACVHSNKTPAEYASMFDTVYVSLYKNFNAPSGAILAGDASFTKELYHTRRMFGGGMPSVWPFVAVALYYVDGFLEEYTRSVEVADQFFGILENKAGFRFEKFPDGTNVLRMIIPNANTESFKKKLWEQNIEMSTGNPQNGEFLIKINPSLLRRDINKLSDQFIAAIQ